MSAEEVSAYLNGLVRSNCEKESSMSSPRLLRRIEMAEPDNRCCFCLNLRQGVIIIGVLNFFFYLLALAWYVGRIGFSGDFELQVSNIDISVFVLFLVQLLTNLLLIIGAVKKVPNHTLPWLCSNFVVICLILVVIFMLVFLGAERNHVTYKEYVSYLISLSLFAGILMFSGIVVYQFRSNLILEFRNPSSMRSSGDNLSLPVSAAPSPPAYEDTTPKAPMLKCLYEDPPPGYEDAIMMPPVANAPMMESPGPHLRKKSLTVQQV